SAGRFPSTSTWFPPGGPGRLISVNPSSPPNRSSGRRPPITFPKTSKPQRDRTRHDMRILLAMGTRPEIIKLGPVHAALQATQAQTEVFWSGQHVELAEGLMDLFHISVDH